MVAVTQAYRAPDTPNPSSRKRPAFSSARRTVKRAIVAGALTAFCFMMPFSSCSSKSETTEQPSSAPNRAESNVASLLDHHEDIDTIPFHQLYFHLQANSQDSIFLYRIQDPATNIFPPLRFSLVNDGGFDPTLYPLTSSLFVDSADNLMCGDFQIVWNPGTASYKFSPPLPKGWRMLVAHEDPFFGSPHPVLVVQLRSNGTLELKSEFREWDKKKQIDEKIGTVVGFSVAIAAFICALPIIILSWMAVFIGGIW